MDKYKEQALLACPVIWTDFSSMQKLFVATLPVFKSCTLNPDVERIIASSHTDPHALTLEDRRIFLHLCPSEQAQTALTQHYNRLDNHRKQHARVIANAAKTSVLYTRHVNNGNFLMTTACKWQTLHPTQVEFVTDTIDDEIVVTMWSLACVTLINACTSTLTTPHPAPECVKQAYTNLRRAISQFCYLSMCGAAEQFARFERNRPIFTKAYVCKAYELLATALFYVISANAYAAEPHTYATERCTLSLAQAVDCARGAYTFLKNETGADDATSAIELEFYKIQSKITLLYNFNYAKTYVDTPVHSAIAYNNMIRVTHSPLVADVLDIMKTMLADATSTNPALETKYMVGYVFNLLQKVNPFSSLSSSNETNYIIKDLEESAPLPDIRPVPVRMYNPADMCTFIFGLAPTPSNATEDNNKNKE